MWLCGSIHTALEIRSFLSAINLIGDSIRYSLTPEGGVHEYDAQDTRGPGQPGVQVGLRQRHRSRYAAARAQRGRHPADLREEEGAGVHAGLAPARLPPLGV